MIFPFFLGAQISNNGTSALGNCGKEALSWIPVSRTGGISGPHILYSLPTSQGRGENLRIHCFFFFFFARGRERYGCLQKHPINFPGLGALEGAWRLKLVLKTVWSPALPGVGTAPAPPGPPGCTLIPGRIYSMQPVSPAKVAGSARPTAYLISGKAFVLWNSLHPRITPDGLLDLQGCCPIS